MFKPCHIFSDVNRFVIFNVLLVGEYLRLHMEGTILLPLILVLLDRTTDTIFNFLSTLPERSI